MTKFSCHLQETPDEAISPSLSNWREIFQRLQNRFTAKSEQFEVEEALGTFARFGS